MKKNLKFLFSGLAFFLILCMVMAPLQTLTARKSLREPWDMTNKITGFLNEPENEFEVMFFGSSHAYASISPLELWKQTGVKSYVYATQRQPLWATYAYIKEALRHQSPSLIVLEANMVSDDTVYHDEGVNHSYMDDLPFSLDKLRLALVSAEENEARAALLFNFIKYHGRWNALEYYDWQFRRSELRDPLKGYVLLDPQGTPQARPDVSQVETVPMTAKNEYWLREIVTLCEKEGIPLWVIKSPCNIVPEDQARLQSAEALLAELGVPYRDFGPDYDAIGLTPANFYDEHHLDAVGAQRFTDFFADALLEAYPALETDPEDSAWQADLADYEGRLAGLS